MTHIVSATFVDADAARRAALALGRTELAAGPTRVQVPADGAARSARLELRVEDRDAPRAIALLREYGAEVADRGDADDLRSGGAPFAAWGMAIADAVTAAMAGASASDAQLPADTARHRDAREAGGIGSGATAQDRAASADATGKTGTTDDGPPAGDGPPAQREAPTGGPVVWGNAPEHGQAGTGSGTHLSGTVAAGTESSMGAIGAGTTLETAMGATDATGTASGTRTPTAPGPPAREDAATPGSPPARTRRRRSGG